MKVIRLLFLSLTLCFGLLLRAQTVNESIVFEQKIHDFGTIREIGGKVSHQFRFTNTGKEPVVILSARAGCSCVNADVPKRPIDPGKTGVITVTFDPDYRPGHFSKEIVVYSAEKKYNRIWVKGDVTPGQHPLSESYRYELGASVRTDYKVLNFGTVKVGSKAVKKLSVANDSDSVVRLDFQSESPAVSVDSGCILPAAGETSVNVTVAPTAAAAEPQTIKLVPIANGKRLQPIEIVVKSSR